MIKRASFKISGIVATNKTVVWRIVEELLENCCWRIMSYVCIFLLKPTIIYEKKINYY